MNAMHHLERPIAMTQQFTDVPQISMLSIDPSINNCGWTWWQGTTETMQLKETGCFKGLNSKAVSLTHRIVNMGDQLFAKFYSPGLDYCIIEQPGMWGGRANAGGCASNNLPKLFFATGALLYAARCLTNNVIMVTVQTWKGQKKKHHTEKEMKRIYGNIASSDHEWDAIGIGHWFITNQLKKYEAGELP
jgi:hypothetical protein